MLAWVTKEVNQLVERAIATNHRAPDNGTKGEYNRNICSWEWQHCCFKRFKASHGIGKSIVRLFRKSFRPHPPLWVWSNVACTNAIIKFVIYLKTWNSIILLCIENPACRITPRVVGFQGLIHNRTILCMSLNFINSYVKWITRTN